MADAGRPGSAFAAGADRWLDRLGSVRNVVRQELAARFLAGHLPAATRADGGLRVLDAGCGQGTQGLRLAAAGHQVTGLDVEPRMLAAFRTALDSADAGVRDRVELFQGSVEEAPGLLPTASYDVVVCHGVLMYLADPAPTVAALASMLRPGGVLSLLACNQGGIALRAAHRLRWEQAFLALEGARSYVDEVGVTARADTVEELSALVRAEDLEPLAWYGVRVLSDGATLDAPATMDDVDILLRAEELAGRTDPYRSVAPLFQLIARRPGSESITGSS